MIIIKNKQGFSFIEAVIYLAIVGILLTAVVSLHLTLGGTISRLSSNILTSRNRRVALSSIDYLVKNADATLKDLNGECSALDDTPPVLALYFEDDTYLPGTCVANGGGVRISVADKKLKLTCYPNMSGNGYYQNCDTTVYPAGNAYYLSSSDVVVLNSSLAFAISTATSTANNFLTISTNLSVGTHSSNQVRLRATSTATSTAILRNEQASGLISWWKVEVSPSPAFRKDSQGSNNATFCDASPISSGLIDGSNYHLDFASDYCTTADATSLNFNNSFTITAWVEEDTTVANAAIVNKSDTTTKKGYGFFVDNGEVMLRICDSNTCQEHNSTDHSLANNTIYHIAATYDLDNDEAIIYVYQKAVGGKATTTFNSLNTLVNYSSALLWGQNDSFDGGIDDVRIYNRVLSKEEIWALQSQGAN